MKKNVKSNLLNKSVTKKEIMEAIFGLHIVRGLSSTSIERKWLTIAIDVMNDGLHDKKEETNEINLRGRNRRRLFGNRRNT